jgi:16S rRNA (guanine527-N7)-methyltransferase
MLLGYNSAGLMIKAGFILHLIKEAEGMVQPRQMPDTRQLPPDLAAAMTAEPLLAALCNEQKAAMGRLVMLVDELQQSLNLTAIRDRVAMVRYHLADSLALLPALESLGLEPKSFELNVDVGTGGGFPLLPMAIALPGAHWIGVESVQKKAVAVQKMAQELELRNVELLAQRAEDVARRELRGTVDMVTARAVGPAASLLEVGVPLLRVGGRIFLFKTELARAEWEGMTDVLERLGARRAGEYKYRLEGDEQERVIFVAEKLRETPAEFPRRAGVPFKKPLGATR